MRVQLGLGLASLIAAGSAHATVLTVNQNILGNGITTFSSIASAVNFADADKNLANTYDIQITPDTYTNDFSLVQRPMTLEAIGGSGVTMQASGGQLLQTKGIIVIPSDFIGGVGQGLTIKGLTLQGAAISQNDGGNGAGIRDQAPGGTTLRVEDSFFVGNQDGILTAGSNNQEKIEIINTQFLNNGNGTGQTHALYVGDALSLLVQNSLFCGTLEGHNIKSRAMTTTVTGTTGFDGATGAGCSSAGTTSYDFEFPNGGVVNLIDDTLIQGSGTHNTSMIGYGAEGFPYANNVLSLTDVSLTSSTGGIGIQQFGSTGTCTLQNTSFSGPITSVGPPAFCTVVTQSPVTQVTEPGTLALLLTALGCGAALLFARYLAAALPGFVMLLPALAAVLSVAPPARVRAYRPIARVLYCCCDRARKETPSPNVSRHAETRGASRLR